MDAVSTEDMDALVLGAPLILRGLGKKKAYQEVKLEKVLEECELSQEQFVDFCILVRVDLCDW